jgi:hypothetical protein
LNALASRIILRAFLTLLILIVFGHAGATKSFNEDVLTGAVALSALSFAAALLQKDAAAIAHAK